MQAMALVFASSGLMTAAEGVARIAQFPFVHNGAINHLPGMLSGWTQTRDLMPLPKQSFRHWWSERESKGGRGQH
jgi:L-lactate dehydrogenase complex protein LldF